MTAVAADGVETAETCSLRTHTNSGYESGENKIRLDSVAQ
jgi:hypothetical protein